jgi:NADPH2:quinone reductase
VVHAFGPPSSFGLERRDPGPLGAGELRVAIRAAGVSFVDILVAAGKYQLQPPLPFVPGSEFSGVVEAVGDGVDPARIGQRVCATVFGQAFSQAAQVPATACRAIPDAMGFEEAAVFQVSYATAYHALVQRACLQPGETLLVLGAAGAVGYAAVQLGKAFGARVIGSASTAEKRDLVLKAGADAVVDAGSQDWRAAVKAANFEQPVDVVLDPVGGAATELAFRSLAWGGRHLVIGFLGGIPKLPTNLALLKGAALIGVDIRQMGEKRPDLAAANMDRLFALYEQGEVNPAISGAYPLHDFVRAMEIVESGRTAGRIVLTMASAN